MDDRNPALGVVLAGGAATRFGGAKAGAILDGRPLIEYPLAAFAEAGIEVVVAAKRFSALPPLSVELVEEPDEPSHPLLGVITGLRHAGDRAIVTCPCDTPHVGPDLLARLAKSYGISAARTGSRLQPLIARFEPSCLPELEAGLSAGSSMTKVVADLGPALIEIDDRTAFNVNTEADVMRAAREPR